jgi:hypothetical protein
MWLPRDERHILLAYYVNIFDLKDRNAARYVRKPKLFVADDWASVLEVPQWMPVISPLLVQRQAKKVTSYGEGSMPESGDDIISRNGRAKVVRTIELQKRLEVANAHLEARRLLSMHPHESASEVKGVFLTVEGCDLGRRYASWFDRGGLWFREHKDHWLWLIISFAGGVLGALVVQWLSR